MTPLMYAASVSKPEVCELLLMYGADLAAKDNVGRTPMHYCWMGGNPENFDFLTWKTEERNY